MFMSRRETTRSPINTITQQLHFILMLGFDQSEFFLLIHVTLLLNPESRVDTIKLPADCVLNLRQGF